jgi:hypothetical protein
MIKSTAVRLGAIALRLFGASISDMLTATTTHIVMCPPQRGQEVNLITIDALRVLIPAGVTLIDVRGIAPSTSAYAVREGTVQLISVEWIEKLRRAHTAAVNSMDTA